MKVTKPKLLLCLALVLSGGLFGCSTAEPTRQQAVTYEKPGEVITIHFDESLSKLGKLQLATGSIVKVAFGNGILTLAGDEYSLR